MVGFQVKNKYLNETDLVNILKWQAPLSGSRPVAYRIFRNSSKKLIGTVGGLDFKDPNREKGVTYTYFVVSVDAFGNESTPVQVTVPQDSSSSS